MKEKANLQIWLFTVVFLLTAFCTAASADIRYVDVSGPNGVGTSWATAYKHLQDALYDAYNIDPNITEIWVAEGVYRPDENNSAPNGSGLRDATFQLINGIAVYGGFPTGGGTWEQRNSTVYTTVLSGDLEENDTAGLDPCSLFNHSSRADNSYHVAIGVGAEPNVTLDGFVITAGEANSISPPYYYGGGIYIDQGGLMISNCTFSKNAAGIDGGGMYSNDSTVEITNCIFIGNYAFSFGGGIYNSEGTADVTNCVFNNNVANKGGGIYAFSWDLDATNCTFTFNQADKGGGIYYDNGGQFLSNCILWDNLADTGGSQMATEDANIVIDYCAVEGGLADIYIPDPNYGPHWQASSIDLDPQFVDADGADNIDGTEDDNLTLSFASPCIDAGNNAAVPAGVTTDLAGNQRIQDGNDNGTATVDMGAYESLPSIDGCNNAAEVEVGQSYEGTTDGATGTDMTGCTTNDTNDVWYKFTPTVSTDYTFSLCGSGFDTSLAIFSNCNIGEPNLACNDDNTACGVTALQSQITIALTSDTTCLIRIAGYNGETGDYVLTVSGCSGPIEGDLNNDCTVDFEDFAKMASNWLECNLKPKELCWQ